MDGFLLFALGIVVVIGFGLGHLYLPDDHWLRGWFDAVFDSDSDGDGGDGGGDGGGGGGD